MPNMQQMQSLANMSNMPPMQMPNNYMPVQSQNTLINQPFIHLSNYEDERAIRAAFPAAHTYNDPQFDPESIKNAQFYILRSSCDDDIHKSIKYGIWTSSYRNNAAIHQDFSNLKKSSGVIYAFYTVVSSEQYLGVAQITGDPDLSKSFNYWWEEGKWNGLMNVKWLYIKDIPYQHFKHLEEGDKPIPSLRDGTKISFENGIKMLSLFKDTEGYGNIFEAFAYMDDREEKLRLTRDLAQNLYKNMNPGNQFDPSMQSGPQKSLQNDYNKKPYNQSRGGYQKNMSNRGDRKGFVGGNNYKKIEGNNNPNVPYKEQDKNNNMPANQNNNSSMGNNPNQQSYDRNVDNRPPRDNNYNRDNNNFQPRDRNNRDYHNRNPRNMDGVNNDQANLLELAIKKKSKQVRGKKTKGVKGGYNNVEYTRKEYLEDQSEYVQKKEQVQGANTDNKEGNTENKPTEGEN